ncbi:MAG: hypothetical protein EBS48_03955 [Actinobacteria bacterium]|nr:hypothetical protein [Actinomycetota bacterium]NBR67250.1 hypothetical protein [Actinomycetota bacterium]NBU16160.1 hypothetical protein [Actinomycetota bacterium]
MIKLDAATVLLQWGTGGLFFLWFTTRRYEIGRGYGWLIRITYLLIAAGGIAAALATDVLPVREAAAAAVVLVSLATMMRRNPRLDIVAPVFGLVGVVAGALDAASGAGDVTVSLLRAVVGTFFLGAVSDAMLLGHWYLVQPGLPRRILNELVVVVRWLLPVEVAVMLLPTGMIAVLGGSVDDGWNGTLGWFWLACAVTTAVLIEVTIRALKERSYSAVMAATGLMYLAILTAFGTDLVARAVLA